MIRSQTDEKITSTQQKKPHPYLDNRPQDLEKSSTMKIKNSWSRKRDHEIKKNNFNLKNPRDLDHKKHPLDLNFKSHLILKRTNQKVSQNLSFSSPHPLIFTQDQRFDFFTHFPKNHPNPTFTDTITLKLRYHKLSISPLQPYHSPSS